MEEVEVDVDDDVALADAEALAEDEALKGKNGAASFGLDERKPAVTSPPGHPDVHGFALQQPRNGGDVLEHVYHRLPVGIPDQETGQYSLDQSWLPPNFHRGNLCYKAQNGSIRRSLIQIGTHTKYLH